MIKTLCYRTYEKKYGTDEFLHCYFTNGTQEQVDEINRIKPEKVHGFKVNWSEVKEFFIHEQEPFDTTGN